MSIHDDNDECCSACEQIQDLYTRLALCPDKEFGWGKGKDNARHLGYEEDWLNQLPDQVWESSAAVGNPFSLGLINKGETVVDLGCGAGADLCIAALLVGKHGHVIGIDITEAMVDKARTNASLLELRNVEVHQADIVKLPIPDACVDVVISNGTINLSPSKPCVFKEAFRVLRDGGRLQFADMVKDKNYKSSDCGSGVSWADCVAGTVLPDCLVQMIKDAGFQQVEQVSFTDYRTAPATIGATFRAVKL